VGVIGAGEFGGEDLDGVDGGVGLFGDAIEEFVGLVLGGDAGLLAEEELGFDEGDSP
jgi:hypothetical protein